MAPLDPDARAYIEAGVGAPPIWEADLAEIRTANDAGAAAVFGEVAEVASVEDREADGVPVRVFRPDALGELPGVVWCHGGGWVYGSVVSHDPLCRSIAARTPAVVVSVDYRLAPEHRFPAALDDSWTATRWTARHAADLGIDPTRLAVGGDSAGGNLAAVAALRARDAGLSLALQILSYPVIDWSFDTASYAEHAEGLNLTRAAMEWFWEQYLGGADGTQPDASPLRAVDPSGAAPALVQIAEHDVLRSEAEAYARRLADAGVPVTAALYEGLPHGFVRMPGVVPRAVAGLDEIVAALRVA